MAVGYIKRLAGPYTGAGTTALPFGFKIFEPTDVYVAVAANSADQPVHLVYGTDYTVSMNESQDATPGGTVTLVAALSGTQVAVVGSALAYTQETQLTNYNRFPPEIVNTALDRIVVQIQQIIEQLGRVLKVPETADITPEELIKSLQDAAETATDIAKGYAEAAKKSEEKTAEYAEAATVIAPFKDEIKTVADNIDNVVTVGQSIEDVKKVSEVNAEVAAVGTGIQSVKTVADAQNLASVHIVAGISEHVVRTSEISAAVVTVSNASDHVANVSRSMDDVKNVSNGMPDIQTVAGDLSGGKCTQQKFTAGRLTDTPAQDCTVEGGNIKTVADHIASVDKVAGTVDDGTLEKAANSIETTAENVSRAEAAQTAAEKAQTAAESAKAAADTSANNSADSAVLSKKWATQTTAPVEGELYGAKYYAKTASEAADESYDILEQVKTEGAEQTAAAKRQADAAAASAESAKQSAETAAFAIRLCLRELSDFDTAFRTTLSPDTNAKVGDSVVDVAGNVYSIVKVDDTSFSVGVKCSNLRGERGPRGDGVQITDAFDTEDELLAAYPTGTAGQCVLVGNKIYVWSPTSNQWVSSGDLAVGGGMADSVEWDQVQNKPALASFDEISGGVNPTLQLKTITYDVI